MYLGQDLVQSTEFFRLAKNLYLDPYVVKMSFNEA